MLLRKSRSHIEIYNELDAEVVSYFRVLRDPAKAAALREAVHLTPFARGEFELAKPHPADDDIERARKIVVRSFMGFSSEAVYRKPNEKAFRTPSYDCGEDLAKSFANWPAHIVGLTERLRGVTIEQLPALDAIAKYDKPDTLFYVDPPYVLSTRYLNSDERGMYAIEMTDADHKALAAMLHRVRGFVVLSGYDCPLYADLYAEWDRYSHQTKTNRNAIKNETVWLNGPAEDAQLQGKLF